MAAKLKSKESKAKNELLAILGSSKLPEEVIDNIVDWKLN